MDEIERFLAGAWEADGWDETEPERVLATVLFGDIVDSRARAAELGDRAWQELLEHHDAHLRRELRRFRGTARHSAGDGFLASFDGPARAIRCGCVIVETMRELGVEVRVGLHTGECELIDGTIAGIAVDTGARVAEQAGPGEVVVTGTVKDLVAGSGIRLASLGATGLGTVVRLSCRLLLSRRKPGCPGTAGGHPGFPERRRCPAPARPAGRTRR